MKSAWKRSVASFFLWSALAGLAAAQGADKTREWEAWKGTPAPWKDAAEAERTVADYRAWLAELRVKLMTGRTAELPGWEERLELIRVHATSVVGLPAQRELLVEVTRARAQALSTQGRYDEARAAAQAVLLAPGDPAAASKAEGQRVSAPPALLALAESALADPALQEVRVDLSLSDPPGSAQDDGLDDRLRRAIAEGNLELVSQVGARAAPALEEAIAADLERIPASKGDAFSLLVSINEPRAAAFALAHIDAGYAFRLRVVRAMESNRVFRNEPGVWSSARGDEPRVPLIAEWSLVLARLLGYPDSAANSLPSAVRMIAANGLTPEVEGALVAALRRSPAELVPELHRHLAKVNANGEANRGLFRFLIEQDDVHVRRLAAWYLLSLGDVPTLLGQAADPDPEVRGIVARAIRGNQELPPSTDDAAVAVLRRLLADPSVDVRKSAVSTLLALPRALEPDLYRAAARDADPGVRSALAWVSHPDDALVSEVLLSLARETDPLVRKEVDGRLTDQDERLRPRALLPAAEVRLSDPTWPEKERTDLIRRLCTSDEGIKVLFAVTAGHPEGSLLAAVLNEAPYFRASTGGRMRALLVLEDAALARAYVQVHGASRELFRELEGILGEARPPRWTAMQAVLADGAAPVDVRLRAAARAAAAGGEGFRAALLALFAAEPLRSRQLSELESETLDEILDAVPDEDRNPLALAALQDEALNDRVRARIAGAYGTHGPLARELTLGILERWLDAEDGRAAEGVGTALQHLRSLPEDLDPALLFKAMQNPWYAEAAVNAMSALQDPIYLPALESAVSPEWNGSWIVQDSAIVGLTAFPGDQATEILLRAAATGSPPVRQHCLAALGTRREIEAQRRLWADSKEARLDRADAVQKLLAQLRDADAAIRGQAARALATLGALETLPALIELLKDGDPAVRKAAGEALERLNALPAREG